jgi:hypothetical protein
MPSPVAEILRALGRALDELRVGWYLFGAQAALARGSHRLTEDIDVTVLLGNVTPEVLITRLQATGFSVRVPNIDDFLTMTRVLPFVHEATTMPVDVVIGGPGLEELFHETSERLLIGDVLVPVPTVEHLIVMKLLAGRPHDLLDAEAMARANEVDLDGVEELASAIAESIGEHDILTALARLRRAVSQ